MNGEDSLKPIPPLKNFCSKDIDGPLTALGRAGEAENIHDGPIRRLWLEHTRKEMQKAAKPGSNEGILLGEGGSGNIEIKMVEVAFGEFLMGDDENGPIHRVHITRPFMVSATPITQVQYQVIMGKNSSEFKGENRPVEKVSWFDAIRFCNELSLQQGLEPAYEIDNENVRWSKESPGYRLPTEAEWEYAARAGTTSVYYGGDLEIDLDGQGWYRHNSKGETQETGMKTANGWGLMDMHGNVWEWVWDRHGKYSPSMHSDPIVSSGRGVGRVMRGGWGDVARDCRSAIRNNNGPDKRNNNVGFRLLRSVSLGA